MIKTITTPIINQIETIVQDIPGWSPIDQLYTLFNMVYLTSDLEGDILEIGCWCGRSTTVLGLAARMIGNTRIQGIDLFPRKNDWKRNPDGSYSMEVTINGQTFYGYQDQTVWAEPFEQEVMPFYEKYPELETVFWETITKNNLQDLVVAFKGTSTLYTETATAKNFRCKLAFIDGDHSYEAVCQDIHNVESVLVKGGWICFDDAFSSYEGVNRAIEDCIINNPTYELQQQLTRKFFVARKK